MKESQVIILAQIEALKASAKTAEDYVKISSSIEYLESLLERSGKRQKKFTAKEYALTYILDLYANGKQIPANNLDGGLDKKKLMQIGFELYQFEKDKDTFYRAVKEVKDDYDLNKLQHLQSISPRWYLAVKALSKSWFETESYLRSKRLLDG